jgi:hypothetical protein
MLTRLARAAAVVLALAGLGQAHASADGEAGLVIQDGDIVRTFCIPFTGDAITGDGLLKAAGVQLEQFGGTGGGVVCAIDGVGCFDASSFDSCWCQCASGTNCTYWAFFTQRYGANWAYSAVAYTGTRTRDGDLQGWKWGRGGSQSAPAPAPSTFEQICGHAPRGGIEPTATLAAVTAAPAATATSAPSPAPPGTSPDTTAATAPVTATSAPSPLPSEAITVGRASPAASVAPPASGGPAVGDGGSSRGPLAFGAVAAVLVLAIGGAALWRRRRGS